MFKYTNKTFHVSRGDSGTINLAYENSRFPDGATVEFKIYEKDGLDSQPLTYKTVTAPTGGSDSLALTLLSADTDIGTPENERVEYWYEIKVGGNVVCGFDEQGAKIFYLYPAGQDKIK